MRSRSSTATIQSDEHEKASDDSGCAVGSIDYFGSGFAPPIQD